MKTSVKALAFLATLVLNCYGFRLNTYQRLLSARALSESCEGRCDTAFNPDSSCQCNDKCSKFNDCCDDYDDKCGGSGDSSCAGRCNQSYNSHEPCQCNSACLNHGDCCKDYKDQCGGSGGGVTDQDLKDFSEQLFAMSRPEVLGKVSINTQSDTSRCGPDKSPFRVYQVEDEAALLNIETVSKLIPLFDNYIPDQHKTEHVTPEESLEEDEFMTSVMATKEMRMAYEFLHTKGVFQSSYNDFSAHVKKLWFGIFNRGGGTRSSSGFEHVFVGETTDNGKTVGGQHNWVRLYLLEQQDSIQYKGYIDHEEFTPANSTSVYGLTQVYDWNGAHKCIGGGMVASVPELEMALATVCFKTRANQACNLAFNGKEFNYKTIQMHYDGYNYINTAYPVYN